MHPTYCFAAPCAHDACAADSELLLGMIRQATAVPLIYQSYMTYASEHRDAAWQDHVRVLGALKARDPERAEALMKAHVLWARDVALEHLDVLEREGDAA